MFTASRLIRVLILVFVPPATRAVAGEVHDEQAKPTRFVGRFCTECHGANDPEADFGLVSMDELSESEARTAWHRVWRQLDSRDMPPADAEQPSEAEREAMLAAIVAEHGEMSQPMSNDLWSLSPPMRADSINSNQTDVSAQLIDRWVDRRLAEEGLTRSPEPTPYDLSPDHVRLNGIVADAGRKSMRVRRGHGRLRCRLPTRGRSPARFGPLRRTLGSALVGSDSLA